MRDYGNADQIIGIAVLDTSDEIKELHVLCYCGATDKKRRHTSIPVYPKGDPKIYTNQWEYEIQPGAILKVTPSLNWIDVFHNGGLWHVPFEEFSAPRPNFRSATDLFKALNGIGTPLGLA